MALFGKKPAMKTPLDGIDVVLAALDGADPEPRRHGLPGPYFQLHRKPP